MIDRRMKTSTGHALSAAAWLDTHYLAGQPEYEAVLRSAGFQAGWRVLDAGCGGGSYLPLLGDLLGPDGRLSAVDLAAENVARVEALLGRSGVTPDTIVVVYSGLSNLLATFAFWPLKGLRPPGCAPVVCAAGFPPMPGSCGRNCSVTRTCARSSGRGPSGATGQMCPSSNRECSAWRRSNILYRRLRSSIRNSNGRPFQHRAARDGRVRLHHVEHPHVHVMDGRVGAHRGHDRPGQEALHGRFATPTNRAQAQDYFTRALAAFQVMRAAPDAARTQVALDKLR